MIVDTSAMPSEKKECCICMISVSSTFYVTTIGAYVPSMLQEGREDFVVFVALEYLVKNYR